jgi:hypothetical protein
MNAPESPAQQRAAFPRPEAYLREWAGFPLPLLVYSLLLLAVFLALWWALRPAPEWRIEVGAPGDSPLLVDFYAPETNETTSFRWSSPYSQLRLPGTYAGEFTLRMRLYGGLLHEAGAPALRFEHAGRELAAFEAAPEWRVYHILLPGKAAPGSEFATAPVDIISATVSPSGDDSRHLGVAFDWLHLSPVASATLPTLLHAAWLTWALVLLVGGLALLPLPGRWWVWRGGDGVVAAVVVVVYARAHPYGVAERLPVSLWWLLPATAALLAWRTRRSGLALWCGALAISLYPRVLLAGQMSFPGPNDAVFYYTVAESLASGHGFQVDYIWNYLSQPQALPYTSNDYWLPLTAVIISGALWLFDISLFAAVLPGMLAAVLLSLLTYAFGRVAALPPLLAWIAAALVLLLKPVFLASLLPETIIYYALFTAASLLCMAKGRDDWRFFLLAGLCGGLAHLTRQDGVLLLPTLLLMVALAPLPLPRKVSTGALALACYGLVLLPLLVANMQTFGRLFPPGPAQVALLLSYEDLYFYTSELSLRRYLEAGPGALLHMRAAVIPGYAGALALLLPPLLWLFLALNLGRRLWNARQRAALLPYLPPACFLALLLLLYTLISVVPGPFSVPRSLVALLPFLVVLAVEGVNRFVRLRTLRLLALLAVGVLALGQGIATQRAELRADRHLHRQYLAVQVALRADGADADTVVMTRYPWGVNYSTGYPAIQIPYENRDTILQAARAFDARYLLLEEYTAVQLRPALAEIYRQPGAEERFELVAEIPDTTWKLLRIAPDGE